MRKVENAEIRRLEAKGVGRAGGTADSRRLGPLVDIARRIIGKAKSPMAPGVPLLSDRRLDDVELITAAFAEPGSRVVGR